MDHEEDGGLLIGSIHNATDCPICPNARGETTNYAYDDLSRLLSASVTTGGNPYARAWTYDSIDNTQTRVEGGVTTTYQYNDASSKHAVTHLNNVLKYQYDANGNMTARDGDTLAYDVENRLTSYNDGGVITSYAYNGDGARVKRSVANAGTTYYIGNYYEVYVPNSGTTTFNKYYYFGAQRVAAKIASTLFYFQGDHLGSSSVVMTSAGTSFYSRQTYFPYGAQRTHEGNALPTDYTFTGQKNDDSTGLMYYGARYYDSALGRFIQADTIVPSPLNPQSLNRFAYTLNNPVKYTDPTGHAETCEESCGSEGTGDPTTTTTTTTTTTSTTTTTTTQATTGENQYPNGKECWPHCNDEGVDEEVDPNAIAGVCGDYASAICFARARRAETGMGPINDSASPSYVPMPSAPPSGPSPIDAIKAAMAAGAAKALEVARQYADQITVIGNREATLWARKNIPGVNALVDHPDWSPGMNIDWLNKAFDRREIILKATNPDTWRGVNPGSAYFMELDHIAATQYQRVINFWTIAESLQ